MSTQSRQSHCPCSRATHFTSWRPKGPLVHYRAWKSPPLFFGVRAETPQWWHVCPVTETKGGRSCQHISLGSSCLCGYKSLPWGQGESVTFQGAACTCLPSAPPIVTPRSTGEAPHIRIEMRDSHIQGQTNIPAGPAMNLTQQ